MGGAWSADDCHVTIDFDPNHPWPDRLSDVRDHVAVLAADAEAQLAWLDAPPIVYPVNELGLGLWGHVAGLV
jgi:hypothetical protein